MTPLRRILERPLGESDRQRTFALAAIVLLGAAAALTLTASAPPEERAVETAATSAPAPITTTAPSLVEAPRRATPRAAPPWVARSARRFLSGYLPYLYGRASARSIDGASRRLRRQLLGDRLRVPPAARRRRPRVVALHVRRVPDTRGGWVATARVDDGGIAVYPIELLIVRRPGGGVVARIGGE